MPLSLDNTTLAVLDAALPEGGETRHWHIAQLVPASLSVEGGGQARRLRLAVDLYLVGEQSSLHRLRACLVSAFWRSCQAPRLPLQREVEVPPGELPGHASAPLHFTLETLSAMMHAGSARSWLQYMQPLKAVALPAGETPAPAPLTERLYQALSEWLIHGLPVATVGEATDTALHGPVGHFGPLEPRVLERSAQADLAVDATWLGEADNAAEQGGQATLWLTLYGERHGAWLLHRRSRQPLKGRAKPEPSVSACTSEVVVAETVTALLEQAGLGPVEKRLFQQVGLLPPVRLRHAADAEPVEADEACLDAQLASVTALDLSAVAERSRRHLQAIAALAQRGRLTHADTDLLLKLARHLSRQGR